MLLKLGTLTALALTAALVLYYGLEARSINVPHFGKYDIGLFYIPIAVAVLVGTTSAVAVTDGLDALAGGTAALAFGAYGVIAFLQEQTFLATFSFTVVGATLGFLWYNAHPARVIMGDTGAMALGASLAVVALCDRSLAAPARGGCHLCHGGRVSRHPSRLFPAHRRPACLPYGPSPPPLRVAGVVGAAGGDQILANWHGWGPSRYSIGLDRLAERSAKML
jgi:preprotein translocase subunit SecG